MEKNNTSSAALEINSLYKSYKQENHLINALNGVSFSVMKSEIFAFLGPNGAGKTSTIKSILSLINPDSGDIKIFGSSNQDSKIRSKIGYLPEVSCFSEFLTAKETLLLFSRLHDAEIEPQKIDSVLKEVNLEADSKKIVKNFSKGMRQRLGLAQAILHNPDMLILDEPLSGLDPLGRAMMKDIILKQKDLGKTVFLSSHQLLETEQLCDRAAIICNGKIIEIIDIYKLDIQEKDFSPLEKIFIKTLKKYNVE
jgi:ABC-2 type transport system ATP-binding protein